MENSSKATALFDLVNIIEQNRQNGKTTTLAKAAFNGYGTLLVYSESDKERLKADYPDLNVIVFQGVESLSGIANRPIFIDHFLLFNLVSNIKNELELERKKSSDLEQKYVDLKNTAKAVFQECLEYLCD